MPVSATIGQDTRASSPVGGEKSLSGRLFDAVNDYRHSRRLKPVQRHAGLDRLAQEHCEYLRRNRGQFSLHGKYVSHIGSESRALVAREHYQMSSVSENVAAAIHPGNAAVSVIIQLWKNSNDHHKNMIDDWSHSGIGVAVDSDGMVFATQLFSTKNHSQLIMRDRFNSY